MNEPLFQENFEAARCALLAPHIFPLKEFTSPRKEPETKGEVHPVWGYPWVQPERTTGFPQAESVFWVWVREKGYQRQELDQLKAELALSSVLDQRELRIEFAHLIAKRQLSVGGSARGERGYGVGASHERAAPREHARHGSGGLHSGLEEPEEASYDYEPPITIGGSRSPSRTVDPAVALQQEEMRFFRDRLYAVEIALGLGPGGQATAQSGKQGTLEGLCTAIQILRHEIRDLHDRVDRRAAVGEVWTLRQEFYLLRSELRALRETQPYGYPLSYDSHAYCTPPMGHQAYVASAAELGPHASWSYDQRGYPPAYREPAPASAGHPRVSETPSRLK
ncbi:unnamed protein product [Phytophthora fragariaefolia]|uniref:Unnamed protein product n=1 Tax=Phytophthora fragariaefolia TaxID=1490495 RepID=A0A9W6XRV9_9STRA|nr:unnamed protein product [Phytophthora fragariaefolia]